MVIVDAHLDLAYNASTGRDVLRPAAEQTADADGIPTVGLPDLRAGKISLVCGTIFCMPSLEGKPGYHDPDQAHAAGVWQLDWYQQQARHGLIRIVTNAVELPDGPTACRAESVPALLRGGSEEHPNSTTSQNENVPTNSVPGPSTRQTNTQAIPTVILLEGADPIRTPAEADWWFQQGVRIVGLAWKRTRYAGGTGQPGGLTPDGRKLVEALDRLGMIIDISHLAELAFWEVLELSSRPVMASHSNCRAIVPTDRQLSDDMILAIARRGGVIGINFYDKFLLPPEDYGKRRAALADVIGHVKHICDLVGDCRHVGIGTDMDGGLGREQIPSEITTSADLRCLADAASSAGFSDSDIRNLMGENWLRYFHRWLPDT